MPAIKNLLISFFILLTFVFSVEAQTTFKVVVDELAGEANVEQIDSGDYLTAEVEGGRCYCCYIHRRISTDQARFGTKEISIDGGDFETLSVTNRGQSRGVTDQSAARVCFSTPSGAETATIKLEMLIFDSASSPNTNVNDTMARCTETTLYGGFNTSVTDFNFLEINNTLNAESSGTQSVTGTITAINVVPSTDTTVIDEQEFSVSAGSRTDVDIHAAAGTGAFGPVRVCHDGPPGAIKAVMSQYNITTTTPLAFSPVAQQVFKTRKQLMGR